MAQKSFDYSKWDKIELSDDESDCHPNIDKESWFRLKHRTRLEREAKEDQEIAQYQQQNKENEARLSIINARLNNIRKGGSNEDAEFEDEEALENEAAELNSAINERNKRISEINEKRKWNIDNICKVTEEKTIVNDHTAKSLKPEIIPVDSPDITSDEESVQNGDMKPTETVFTNVTDANKVSSKSVVSSNTAKTSGPSVPNAVVNKGSEPVGSLKREKMAVISYNDYVIKHEQLLEKYSEIFDLEETKEFLFKNCDVLLHEHSQSYLLLSSLEDEMNGKKKRMKLVSRQSQILSHIHDLGASMRRDPRDVVLPFFKRIEEKEYLQGFLSAVEDFIQKIQKRAVVKRKEMELEERKRIMEEQEGSVPLGPGGLDPYEVLESLPDALRDAFESQDVSRLTEELSKMNPADAKYHMKRCVDSGLWVPKDSSIYDDNNQDAEEDEHTSDA
eukprot:gene8995-12135_t